MTASRTCRSRLRTSAELEAYALRPPGSAPNRTFVIEWATGRSAARPAPSSHSRQPRGEKGEIVFNYADMNRPPPSSGDNRPPSVSKNVEVDACSLHDGGESGVAGCRRSGSADACCATRCATAVSS
jgi:hypothetical protein